MLDRIAIRAKSFIEGTRRNVMIIYCARLGQDPAHESTMNI